MCVISVMQRNDFSLMESEPGSPAGAATVGPTSRAVARTHQARTARRRHERQGLFVWGSVCSAIDRLIMILILVHWSTHPWSTHRRGSFAALESALREFRQHNQGDPSSSELDAICGEGLRPYPLTRRGKNRVT